MATALFCYLWMFCLNIKILFGKYLKVAYFVQQSTFLHKKSDNF
jgi:hypothetical protein